MGNDLNMVEVSAVEYFLKTGAPATRTNRGTVTEWWKNGMCIGKMNYNKKGQSTFWLHKSIV